MNFIIADGGRDCGRKVVSTEQALALVTRLSGCYPRSVRTTHTYSQVKVTPNFLFTLTSKKKHEIAKNKSYKISILTGRRSLKGPNLSRLLV